MLTLYARYRDDELRALQAHCLDFCAYQYDKGDPYRYRCEKLRNTPRLQRSYQFSVPL